MRYGVASLLIAGAAIALGVAAATAERYRIPGSAHILFWLDLHGLVKAPDLGRVQEWRSADITLLTDGAAIFWLKFHSWWFAVIGACLACYAETLKEDSLYSSAGLVCASLAFLPSSIVASLLCLLIGSAFILLWRSRRDA